MNKLMLLSFITLFMYSCQKETNEDVVDAGFSFYPYSVGSWVVFSVDSTYYDDFTHTQYDYHFLLKEYFESIFVDDEGRPNMRIERYVKMSDTSDWYLRDVWYVHVNSFRVEKVEENIRFVRLIFPVKENATWDGNAMNTLEEQKYQYTRVNYPYSVDTLHFDSTATVIQQKVTNLLEEKDQYEVYARHVGLIEKFYKDVKKDLVSGNIVGGIIYRWKIVQYKI